MGDEEKLEWLKSKFPKKLEIFKFRVHKFNSLT